MLFPVLLAGFLPAGLPESFQDRIFEEKAGEILEEASALIQSHESLYIGFDYTVHDPRNENGVQDKGVLYTRGDQYYMQLGSHYFISDGETAWVFMEEFNEVHISLAEDAGETVTPGSLLQNVADRFRSKWIREETIDGQNVHIIDMVPTEPQAFFKYRLAIKDAGKQLLYIEAHDRQGGIFRYDIIEYEPDPELPENRFVFEPDLHPGIEVIDLR